MEKTVKTTLDTVFFFFFLEHFNNRFNYVYTPMWPWGKSSLEYYNIKIKTTFSFFLCITLLLT